RGDREHDPERDRARAAGADVLITHRSRTSGALRPTGAARPRVVQLRRPRDARRDPAHRVEQLRGAPDLEIERQPGEGPGIPLYVVDASAEKHAFVAKLEIPPAAEPMCLRRLKIRLEQHLDRMRTRYRRE